MSVGEFGRSSSAAIRAWNRSAAAARSDGGSAAPPRPRRVETSPPASRSPAPPRRAGGIAAPARGGSSRRALPSSRPSNRNDRPLAGRDDAGAPTRPRLSSPRGHLGRSCRRERPSVRTARALAAPPWGSQIRCADIPRKHPHSPDGSGTMAQRDRPQPARQRRRDDRARGRQARRRGAQGAARLQGILGAGSEGRPARARSSSRRASCPSGSDSAPRACAARGPGAERTGRMPRALASSPSLLLPLSACFPRAAIPDAERERLSREVAGQQRYLRVAAYAGPLWGDAAKVFVSELPPGEVDLVESAGHTPIPPPAAERVLPPGTPVPDPPGGVPGRLAHRAAGGDDAPLPPLGLPRRAAIRAARDRALADGRELRGGPRRAGAAAHLRRPEPLLLLASARAARRDPPQGAARGDERARARDGVGAAGAKADRPPRRHRGVDLAGCEAPRLPPGRSGWSGSSTSRNPIPGRGTSRLPASGRGTVREAKCARPLLAGCYMARTLLAGYFASVPGGP